MGESDLPSRGPLASFSVHLASISVTPAGSVHKSMGDNLVRMWSRCAQYFVIASCGSMPRDNICMYMEHVNFYVRCSDCVEVGGNVCCVAAVVKDSVF